jgi:glycosyltransferase involved in cell wall biosynthesis
MLFHGVYVLNKEPKVLALWGYDAWEKIESLHKDEPVYFLWHNAWHAGTLPRMVKMKYKFHKLKRNGIKPMEVANTPEEERLRKLFGIRGFECITYVYTDEDDYSVGMEEKKYDAVYAAQLAPFKRIELAKDLDSLFLLTYKGGGIKQWDLHAEYPSMKFADFNREWVGPEEKNKLYNMSRVGLCLSAEEGPMLASLEYMLCGLPVVSTESKGGRDTYYDPAYCLVVKDNAKAVKEGVKELISRNIDPALIRTQTIGRLNRDRDRYAEGLSNCIFHDSGVRLDPEALRKKIFDDPKKNFIPIKEYNG